MDVPTEEYAEVAEVLKGQIGKVDRKGDGKVLVSILRELLSRVVHVTSSEIEILLQGSGVYNPDDAEVDYCKFIDWIFAVHRPTSPGPGGSRNGINGIAVFTLNFLGDAYNAMEFMNNDETFQSNYKVLRKAFSEVKSEDVLEEVGALGFDRARIAELLNQDLFEAHCTEHFLRRDNKLQITKRINMIVGGMAPLENGTPLFQSVSSWRDLMKPMRDNYAQDPELVAWDVACNLASERCATEYATLSMASHLNPSQLPQRVAMMLDHLPDSGPFVCAVQEYPERGTAKYAALMVQVKNRGMGTMTHEAENTSVGFIFSSHCVVENFRQSPLGTDLTEVLAKMNGPELAAVSDKDRKSLQTTAQKTAIVDFSNGLRVASVHCKEFKTVEGTKLLARYLRSLTHDMHERQTAIILCDANTPNDQMAQVLDDGARECDLQVLTPAAMFKTTRKQRSELHGQIYDRKKCLKVVEAHKTFAMLAPASQGSWQAQGLPRIFPDFKVDPNNLPNSEWPTDHCMVSLTLVRE